MAPQADSGGEKAVGQVDGDEDDGGTQVGTASKSDADEQGHEGVQHAGNPGNNGVGVEVDDGGVGTQAADEEYRGIQPGVAQGHFDLAAKQQQHNRVHSQVGGTKMHKHIAHDGHGGQLLWIEQ